MPLLAHPTAIKGPTGPSLYVEQVGLRPVELKSGNRKPAGIPNPVIETPGMSCHMPDSHAHLGLDLTGWSGRQLGGRSRRRQGRRGATGALTAATGGQEQRNEDRTR